MSAAARRMRMLARRARGAHARTVHGPLERVVRRLHGLEHPIHEPHNRSINPVDQGDVRGKCRHSGR